MQEALSFRHSSPFSWREQQKAFNSLSVSNTFDIAVVGGGITGAAIARDAALRGLKTILIEKSDFASGTSSRSSKLIHGGVRYLEQFEFKLVRESVRERALLWKLAPEHTHPLQFLFPTYKESRVSLWKLNIGLWLYDLLALFRTPGIHKTYSAKQIKKIEPGLRQKNLKGGALYWDGATDDARLTLSNVIDAHTLGAVALSRVALTGIEWNEHCGQAIDQGHTLFLENNSTGEKSQIRARSIVCALGPWTDRCPGLEGFNLPKILSTTRGSHVVLPAARLPSKNAVVMFHPEDGRVLFTIPWGEFTVIGTTDIFDEADPGDARITQEEVKYLLRAANHYFPESALKTDDILSTWSGLRPLLKPVDGKSASAISRESFVEWFDPGLLIVTGGKLTTHREMAESAVNKILAKTKKWNVTLTQSAQVRSTKDRALPNFAYPIKSKLRLGKSEASQFDLESLLGICRTQAVYTIEDLLVRRTQIFYKEPDNGLLILEKIKTPLCEEMNWDPVKWEKQYEDYLHYIKRNVWQPLNRAR